MKSLMVWSLAVSYLLVWGTIGRGPKAQPVVEKPGAGVEDPEAVVGAEDVEEEPKAAIEEAVAAQKEYSQRLGSPVQITNSIGMKLALIPAGEFLMGSPESDPTASNWERPQHKVRISKPFYFGVYEVTQAEYKKVMGENPSWFSKGGRGADVVSGKDTSSYPVEHVSWEDAVEFCKRLSAEEEKPYRLPTEVEWEYACRVGTTTRWYCGDNEDALARIAWYGEKSDSSTHPVGAKKANAWGLFDTHGNVFEWCQDLWGPYPGCEAIYAKRQWDVNGPVLRGGCWRLGARYCRAAYRRWELPRSRSYVLGFRVAADPPS